MDPSISHMYSNFPMPLNSYRESTRSSSYPRSLSLPHAIAHLVSPLINPSAWLLPVCFFVGEAVEPSPPFAASKASCFFVFFLGPPLDCLILGLITSVLRLIGLG